MSCKGQQRHRESLQHLRFSARPRNLEAVLGSSLQYKPHGNGMGLHIPNSDFDLRIQFTRTRRTGRTRMWVLSSCPEVVSLCWSSSGRREGWNPIMGVFFLSFGSVLGYSLAWGNANLLRRIEANKIFVQWVVVNCAWINRFHHQQWLSPSAWMRNWILGFRA